MFEGINVALITPFNDDFSVDYETIRKLVRYQIEKKVDGIVALGTTAETANLEIDEYEKILKTIKDELKGTKIKLISSIGSNSYSKVLKYLEISEKIVVDGLLLVTPYYIKPSQRAIYEFFKEISSKTEKPIIIYDIPSRTGVKISNDVIVELSKIKNIVGIKDATSDILSMYDLNLRCDKNFEILSGEDSMLYNQFSAGCIGTISVVANIYPDLIKEMYQKYKEGNIEESKKISDKLKVIADNMFIEGNPVTVKAYMYLKGLLSNKIVRKPLLEASIDTLEKLKILEKII